MAVRRSYPKKRIDVDFADPPRGYSPARHIELPGNHNMQLDALAGECMNRHANGRNVSRRMTAERLRYVLRHVALEVYDSAYACPFKNAFGIIDRRPWAVNRGLH